MSLHEYQQALYLHRSGVQFYALLMAAMWGADTDNTEKLRAAWPDVWDEVYARYHAPGGLLAGETAPA